LLVRFLAAGGGGGLLKGMGGGISNSRNRALERLDELCKSYSMRNCVSGVCKVKGSWRNK